MSRPMTSTSSQSCSALPRAGTSVVGALLVSRRAPLGKIPLNHRPSQIAQRETFSVQPAVQMSNEAHMLINPRTRIPLSEQLFNEPRRVGFQRPPHERTQHFDHDTFLSNDGDQASIRSPDYADPASPQSLSCKRTAVNIDIIRTSA